MNSSSLTFSWPPLLCRRLCQAVAATRKVTALAKFRSRAAHNSVVFDTAKGPDQMHARESARRRMSGLRPRVKGPNPTVYDANILSSPRALIIIADLAPAAKGEYALVAQRSSGIFRLK
jgi:hypothetical protein